MIHTKFKCKNDALFSFSAGYHNTYTYAYIYVFMCVCMYMAKKKEKKNTLLLLVAERLIAFQTSQAIKFYAHITTALKSR